MSSLLFVTALDVQRWFNELRLQGIRLTDGNTGAKLLEEAQEFKDNPSLEEAADCFISLLGAVDGQGWTLNQLAQAVTDKMAINRQRVWVQQPNGTYRHVEGT